MQTVNYISTEQETKMNRKKIEINCFWIQYVTACDILIIKQGGLKQ